MQDVRAGIPRVLVMRRWRWREVRSFSGLSPQWINPDQGCWLTVPTGATGHQQNESKNNVSGPVRRNKVPTPLRKSFILSWGWRFVVQYLPSMHKTASGKKKSQDHRDAQWLKGTCCSHHYNRHPFVHKLGLLNLRKLRVILRLDDTFVGQDVACIWEDRLCFSQEWRTS